MSEEIPFIPEISLDNLIEIVGDEPEVLKDVLESFLEDAPNLLLSVQEGVLSRDEKLVERSAHTLKSSSRLFQAEEFASQCESLEGSARVSDWTAIAEKTPKLRRNFALLEQLLRSELNKL